MESGMKSNIVRNTAILRIIFAICCAFTGAGLPFTTFTAYAMSAGDTQFSTAICPSAAAPTSQSLLVVLLDRSGSLIFQPGATDPNGYSTSVAKALTDLWPGVMAVIPFSGDTTQLPILGPNNLSDPASRADLKNKIQDYPIGGETPLAPAMLEALNLLRGSPPGSRVIIITDGNPSGSGNNDGPHQEQEIRNNLIPQFCQRGIPISTIGLAINPNTPDGQDATRLLVDIAGGTGAVFTRVANAQDLAKVVINLAAQWLGLTYIQVTRQGGTFPVVVDSFATEVSIVTFRSDGQYAITLRGPNGKPVTDGLQRSTDRHYVIDSFKVQGDFPPGSYSVDAGGDPNAQVYVLVSSSLRIQLITPTSKTVAYDNKPVLIEAEFLHGQQVLIPQAGQAHITARVTLLVNGQPAGAFIPDIELTQQHNSPIFSGQIPAYNQPGLLQIQLLGEYQGAERQTTFMFQLHAPPPPSPPCRLGIVQCFWQQYHSSPILIAFPLLLLLFLLLLLSLVWSRQPAPYGWLSHNGYKVSLSKSRPLQKSLFQRSIVSSEELEHRNSHFRFRPASFDILFGTGGRVLLKPTKHNTSEISVKTPMEEHIARDSTELEDGSVIRIEGRSVASFSVHPPTNYSYEDQF